MTPATSPAVQLFLLCCASPCDPKSKSPGLALRPPGPSVTRAPQQSRRQLRSPARAATAPPPARAGRPPPPARAASARHAPSPACSARHRSAPAGRQSRGRGGGRQRAVRGCVAVRGTEPAPAGTQRGSKQAHDTTAVEPASTHATGGHATSTRAVAAS